MVLENFFFCYLFTECQSFLFLILFFNKTKREEKIQKNKNHTIWRFSRRLHDNRIRGQCKPFVPHDRDKKSLIKESLQFFFTPFQHSIIAASTYGKHYLLLGSMLLTLTTRIIRSFHIFKQLQLLPIISLLEKQYVNHHKTFHHSFKENPTNIGFTLNPLQFSTIEREIQH